MNATFKPYRLVNDLELGYLQQIFERKLQDWNKDHALHPLSCQLSRAPACSPHTPASRPLEDSRLPAASPQDPAFLFDKQDLSIIKHSLFGNQSDCFNTQANALFMTLINQLMGTPSLHDSQLEFEDWFYSGTPSLTLTLKNSCGSMNIYLHPQWVLNALPSNDRIKKPTIPLQEALASQQLNVQVELKPMPLRLADIIRLQVGDVIKTDHPITEPAQLSHQQQSICSVEIGKSNSFKSIQITRKP